MKKEVEISEEQIAQYQRDGVVLLKGVLTEEEVKLLEQGLEESYANPGKRFSRAQSPGGEGETFLETFPTLKNKYLQKLIDVGHIPEIAARMMQTRSAQLVLDQVFYKQKGHVVPTPWHQDTPYLRVRGDEMVRVWVTCDFSPKELTLQIVRGCHRWNVVYDGKPPQSDMKKLEKTQDGKMFEFSRSDAVTGPLMPDIAKYRDSFDILEFDVEPGDALVFNGNMLHAAGGAENYPTARRAYASMWGGPNLRYITPPDHAIPTLADVNKHKIEYDTCIGEYPEAFPIGWQE